MRWLRGVVILAFVSCAGPSLAQTQTPAIAPVPAWVDVLPTPEPAGATNLLNEGLRFLLIDHQVNAAADEHYQRMVQEIINQDGVQNGARVSMDFDPTY